jgi:beta-1,2-mannobiose phosphorylase / 1,2-beta-oligomannan phosphorylase
MIKLLGTASKEEEVFLFYSYAKHTNHYFKRIASHDGFAFNGQTKYIIITDPKGREEPKYDWERFSITKQKERYIATYKTSGKKGTFTIAESKETLRWKKFGKVGHIKEFGSLVPDFQYKNRYVLYFGEHNIKLAYSSQLAEWKVQEKPALEALDGNFDNAKLEVAKVFNLKDHILVFYYAKKKQGEHGYYAVGAAGFDIKDPTQLIWRLDQPLWEVPDNMKNERLKPLGIEMFDDKCVLYWILNDTTVYAVSCPIPPHGSLKDKNIQILLKKHHNNPIIIPRADKAWESRATFNSAAIYEDGKVHFVYRALGDKDLSVLGYATSSDGMNIDHRSDEPIYIPREPFETPGGHAFKSFAEHFASGGGYGGIEDPRMTKVGDRIYLTYVAFDGATPPRAAMSSIPVDDFLNHRWDNWEKPKLISAPGMVNKSAVIFPEKVNGKYVVLHRVYPNILVDYLDDLNFDNYLQGQYFIPPRKKFWDSKKVGAGAPPMKTKDGWLLIYQSVGHQDPSRYKIGAMLLDKDNPTKVLYRTNNPIISPDEDYENNGFKAGVVYPCGAVIKDDKLMVYYGGADSVVCAAHEDLDKFLHQMKYNQEPRLKRVTSPMLN